MINFAEVRKKLTELTHIANHADGYERGQSQNFWAQFFRAYGVSEDLIYLAFEHRLKDKKGQKYVDAFIPGKVIVEQKSSGIDLSSAYRQVSDYYTKLPLSERPNYIILSNFDEFRLYDASNPLDLKTYVCQLAELADNAEWFAFLSPSVGEVTIVEENPINRKATESIAQLYQAFIDDNNSPDSLGLFLTRLIFCFYADDTGVFGKKHIFQGLLKKTRPDGSDLRGLITDLFETLNSENRSAHLPTDLKQFAYINGDLFSENITVPFFNAELRDLIIESGELNWSEISPAIFGAMFQAVLDEGENNDAGFTVRREIGAHYTSEKNILKVIQPLFLDELYAEYDKCLNNRPRAKRLYDRLATMTFFDPACGCGNFLIIAYRELRLLENALIALLQGEQKGLLDISHLCRITVEQFFGIEIEPHAAHIARVALWITDHQLNVMTAAKFGSTRPSTPIRYSPHIHCDNALTLDWQQVLPVERCSYVMGNPPFLGKTYQNAEQKAEMKAIWGDVKGSGVLDYVTAWYRKAAAYMQNGTCSTAFVSTNSIAQGEQVAILWKTLFEAGINIHFAHQTFRWSNEGKGIAAVHCVIVGFGYGDVEKPKIYQYDDIDGEPDESNAKQINGYLLNAPCLLMERTNKQISDESPMDYGSKPADGGNLLLSELEKEALVSDEPLAKKYIRPYLGAAEFINNKKRFCLWFDDIDLIALNNDLEQMPQVQKRIEGVKAMRLASRKKPTQEQAKTPHLFTEIRQPKQGRYLIIPRVSSETRQFIPIGYFDVTTINSDANFSLPNATLYHFGILSSTMHNAWMRTVAGRLESRYRYSNTIVYNNYPFPFMADDESSKAENHRQLITDAAQMILDAREKYQYAQPDKVLSLADLYRNYTIDPYPDLTNAHAALDKAVDKAYDYKGKPEDSNRVAFLFDWYQK